MAVYWLAYIWKVCLQVNHLLSLGIGQPCEGQSLQVGKAPGVRVSEYKEMLRQ